MYRYFFFFNIIINYYFIIRDGLSSRAFHEKCDKKGPTLCVVQVGDYLFGGFNPDFWSSPQKSVSLFNSSSFLFTLTNPHNIPPTQYWLKKESKVSIIQDKEHMIRFGAGWEMSVIWNRTCYTNDFPNSYEDTTGKGQNTFTGSYRNLVTELLVFSVQ